MGLLADYQRIEPSLYYRTLPAYVSYVQDDAMLGYKSKRTIVLRTADGTIAFGSDAGTKVSNLLTSPAFIPSCYVPTNERRISRAGRQLIQFELKSVCSSSQPSHFSRLYVDPATFFPVLATGIEQQNKGFADYSEAFKKYGHFAMPASLTVRVGMTPSFASMRVTIAEAYSHYTFMSTLPQ